MGFCLLRILDGGLKFGLKVFLELLYQTNIMILNCNPFLNKNGAPRRNPARYGADVWKKVCQYTNDAPGLAV